jgi:molybdopterin-guanine dinucleotide biosynthesis protein A
VVLAGGRSRRYGRDKALVEVDGVAMAARVAEALRGAGAAPVVAVGGDAAGLGALGLDVWPDAHPGAGPLGALATALEQSGGPVVVVAACDLPWLDVATVDALLVALARDGAVDVAVARTDRREPLVSAWRRDRCREVVRAAFDAGERAVHAALARLRVAEVAVDARAVGNVNRPDDLAR